MMPSWSKILVTVLLVVFTLALAVTGGMLVDNGIMVTGSILASFGVLMVPVSLCVIAYVWSDLV